jgi:hypothetical protein
VKIPIDIAMLGPHMTCRTQPQPNTHAKSLPQLTPHAARATKQTDMMFAFPSRASQALLGQKRVLFWILPTCTQATNHTHSELKVFCGNYVTNPNIFDQGTSTPLDSALDLALPAHHHLLPHRAGKEAHCCSTSHRTGRI